MIYKHIIDTLENKLYMIQQEESEYSFITPVPYDIKDEDIENYLSAKLEFLITEYERINQRQGEQKEDDNGSINDE